MTVRFKVVGDKAIASALESLPQKLQRNTLKRGLRRAGNVFAEEASRLAPHAPGEPDLKDAPKVRVTTRDGVPTAIVYLDGPHAWLGVMFERGVAPHYIDAKDGGALQLGDNVIEGPILHPGVAKHPFMRPAFDARADDAVQAFADYLRTHLRTKRYNEAQPEADD